MAHNPVSLVAVKSFLGKNLYKTKVRSHRKWRLYWKDMGGKKAKFFRQLLVKNTNIEFHEIPLGGLGDKTG